MLRWLNPLLAVYGVLLIASGIQAYFFNTQTAHPNVMSLIGGVVSGLLILGSLALAQTNPRPARIGAAIISLLLAGMFMGRYFSADHAVWPNLILGTLSFVVFLALGAGHMIATAARKKGLADPQAGTVSHLDPATGYRREDSAEA